jgi:hypothetical protein
MHPVVHGMCSWTSKQEAQILEVGDALKELELEGKEDPHCPQTTHSRVQQASMRKILGRLFAAKDHEAIEHLVPPRCREVGVQKPSRNGPKLPKFAPGKVSRIAVAVSECSTFQRAFWRWAQPPLRLADHGVATRSGPAAAAVGRPARSPSASRRGAGDIEPVAAPLGSGSAPSTLIFGRS